MFGGAFCGCVGHAWADPAAPVVLGPIDSLAVQAKLSESVQVDSNPTLATSRVVPLFGNVLTPEAIVSADFPTAHADLDTHIDDNEFNQATLNSVDVHSTLHSLFRGEVWQFGTLGAVDYDTTRTSEELSSGVNVAGLRHLGLSASPQAGLNLGPLDEVLVNGSLLYSFYAPSVSYTNYRVLGVNPSYQHVFDPIDTGFFVVQLSRYQPTQGPPLTIDQVAPMVGWIENVSSQFTVTASTGLQHTIFRYPADTAVGLSTVTDGVAFNIDLAYKAQQDSVHFTASRAPNPTARGTEAETTSVSISNSYSFRENLEFDFDGIYQTSSYQNVALSTQKYYINLGPRIVYHATNHLDFSLGYRYRTEAFINTTQMPVSEGIQLNLIYTPSLATVR